MEKERAPVRNYGPTVHCLALEVYCCSTKGSGQVCLC